MSEGPFKCRSHVSSAMAIPARQRTWLMTYRQLRTRGCSIVIGEEVVCVGKLLRRLKGIVRSVAAAASFVL